MNIGIFFGSNGGCTEEIAQDIADRLSTRSIDIMDATIDDFKNLDFLILASSTWGFGDLPDSWEERIEFLDEVDIRNTYVAFVGVGDQENYGDTFCNSIGTIYEKIKNKHIKHIGLWPTQDYEFIESSAVLNNKFLGLIIDEDNQSDMTEKRISTWIAQIKNELSLTIQ